MALADNSDYGASPSSPLNSMPPQPSLRNATKGSLAMPRPSAASAAISLSGSSGIASTMALMKQIEDLTHQLVQNLPGMSNVADQFLTQMRDMGAAALSDKVSGGNGSTADSGVPAPGATVGAPPVGAPPAGPMPPPPM